MKSSSPLNPISSSVLLSLMIIYLQITIKCLSIQIQSDVMKYMNPHDAMSQFDHVLQQKLPNEDTTISDKTPSPISLEEEIAKLHEPDFLLIGVVKSGSTSLYHYMVQHPEISGVEAEYLLPEDMRKQIRNIIQLRHTGKIPKIAKPKRKALDPSDPRSPPGGIQTINPGSHSVKQSIYEINNFDLARMIKPIIDQKEVRFFDSFWYNHLQTVTNQSLYLAWKWYLQVFNQDTYAPPTMLRGEASPTYFASSQFTAERIKLWLPNIKLILLLRNPVRRLVSHLKMIKENHAANMRFRKMKEIEHKAAKNSQMKPDQYTRDIDDFDPSFNVRRRLLEMENEEEVEMMDNLYDMEEMEQMGQYNPFNAPYNAQANMMGNNMMNGMDMMLGNGQFGSYNVPFAPATRYGARKRYGKRGKRNPMARFMRTRSKRRNTNPQYNMLLQQYQNLLAQQQGLANNWIDGDDPLINELNEDDFDDEDEGNEVEDGYEEDFVDDINDEIEANEVMRQQSLYNMGPSRYVAPPPRPKARPGRGGKKPRKPVNKMEKIIGAIYKLSMYQVILVSNANPDSSSWYCKRWGIARDVSGFINRLLFGGIYTMRMKEWLKRFDSDHFFYRESSTLFDDPIGLMNDLEDFLNITHLGDEKWKDITGKVYNVALHTGNGTGYKHVQVDAEDIEHWNIDEEKITKIPHPTENRKWQSQEIIDMLRDYYRPHNQQLSDLFDGVKYKDWDY